MKLLTFAHRGEAVAFLASSNFSPVDFYFDGLLKSNDCYLLITGEGPQNASEKTITVLANFNQEISEVYNLGVAGSLTTKLKKYDLTWVRTAYAHHAEKLEFKSFSSPSTRAEFDCLTAFVRVVDPNEKQKFSLIASIIDRELWAVASAAHLFKKNFYSLKVISDDLIASSEDICKFVKEEAPKFSQILFKGFEQREFIKPEISSPLLSTSFTDDPLFYLTTSQERKLHSLLEGLRLKGFSLEEILNFKEVREIKAQEKLPKERTRLLLQYLIDRLNPISAKIRESIEDSLTVLKEAKITPSYDPSFEDDWLGISVRIQSSRDLEKVKNALKIFSYEDFKKIFNGQFDV